MVEIPRVNEKEKNRKKIARDIFERMKSLRRPEEMVKFEEQLRRDRSTVFGALAQLPKDQGKQAADALLNLIVNSDAFSHYTGIRRGYRAAKRISKMKSTKEKALAHIVSIVEKHPNWIADRICGALDDQNVRLHWPPKKLPARARYWRDIIKEPKLKMLLSRVRNAVRQDSAARMWSRVMREHDRLRRN